MPDILYIGDRGSGKTTALVLRFCALLDQGVAPSRIQVLSGQKYHDTRRFKTLLFEHRPQALGGFRIQTHRHLAQEILQWQALQARLLNSNDTLFLLQYHYQEHGARFFPDHYPSPGFFEHLLRRHQRCAVNMLWDDALIQRTQALESASIAQQANHFLAHFSAALADLELPLWDPLAQAKALQASVQDPQLKAHFGADYWLIDDLDETRPLDQYIVEALSGTAQHRIATVNPEGGLDKARGANPEYAKSFATQDTDAQHTLQRQRPLSGLARHMYLQLQHLPELQPEDAPHVLPEKQPVIEQSAHTSDMYAAMAQRILTLQQQGVPGHDICCVTWYLDPLAMRHLRAHFNEQGIAIDILQSRQNLQRSPLVNTLLSLLRLVFWPYFQPMAEIPRLNSLDMAQIFRLCGGLDAFTVSDLRARFGDRLEAWGKFLQESESPRLQSLQTCIQALRDQYQEPQIKDFERALQTLWKTQFMPYIGLDSPLEHESFYAAQQLLRKVSGLCELVAHLPQNSTAFFWKTLFAQDVQTYRPLPDHRNGKVKILTVHRLCEQGETYRHQLWFDLSHPNWFRPMNHPIDNTMVLAQRWPLDRPWTLQAEDDAIEERLATAWRKGLLYCDEKAYFYATLYDQQARMQRQDALLYALGSVTSR